MKFFLTSALIFGFIFCPSPSPAAFSEDFILDFSETQFDFTSPVEGTTVKFKGTNNGSTSVQPHFTCNCNGSTLVVQPQGQPEMAPGQSAWFKALIEEQRCNASFTPGTTSSLTLDLQISDQLTPGGMINLQKQATVTAIDPDMPGPVAVNGTVVDQTGQGRGGLEVRLGAPASSVPLRTDPSGYFSHDIAEASFYWLEAQAEDFRAAYQYIDGGDVQPPYTLSLIPQTWSIDADLIGGLTSDIGFYRAAASADEAKLLLVNGMENWPDESMKALSKLYLFDVATGAIIWSHDMGWESWTCDLSDDGAWAVFGTDRSLNSSAYPPPYIRLLNAADGAAVWTKTINAANFPGSDEQTGYSRGLKFSHDANSILAAVERDYVYLLNRSDGGVRWRQPVSQNVREILFSADDQYVYVSSGSGYLHKFRVADGSEVWRQWVGSWAFVNGLDLSPDEAYIAVGTKSADLSVINTVDGAIKFHKEYPALTAVCRFTPNGQNLIVSGGHGAVHLYDLDGHEQWRHHGYAKDVHFPSRGDWFIISGTQQGAILDLYGSVLHVLPSPDGRDADSQVGWLNSAGTTYVWAARDVTVSAEVVQIYRLNVQGPN